ncbi:MAG: cytochrome c [Candidatus Binatia bacterium]|nr:cytochrome c [Candidatus Binatia bacterium]
MKLLRAASIVFGLSLIAPFPCQAEGGPHESQAMFLRYCGNCHGPEGTGNGVMSGFLKKKPADLTQLAKANGGEFPFHKTMRFIDGTQDVSAHGDPAMPVWGEVFKAETRGSPTQQAEIRGKILLITEYVRSIQED